MITSYNSNYRVTRFFCRFTCLRFRRNLMYNGVLFQRKKEKCTDCGREFAYRKDLKAHSARQHGAVMFPCDKCQMAFPSNQLYQRHRRICVQDLKVECDRCQKLFTTRTDMLRHQIQLHNTSSNEWCKCGANNTTQANNLFSQLDLLFCDEILLMYNRTFCTNFKEP